VTLDIPRTHPDVVLPSETLIFDQAGTHVAVVGDDEKVRMVPVTIKRDFGTAFEIDQGPKGGDTVVLSPPASLRDGAKVAVQRDDAGGGAAPGPEKVSEK
jgi:multidrug efflux pump subunit AcrA (membrane-fusion protein)